MLELELEFVRGGGAFCRWVFLQRLPRTICEGKTTYGDESGSSCWAHVSDELVNHSGSESLDSTLNGIDCTREGVWVADGTSEIAECVGSRKTIYILVFSNG